MIDTSRCIIHAVSIHRIGKTDSAEPLQLSDNPLTITDERLRKLLLTYFLSNFTTPEYYHFTAANGDYKLNPLFQFVHEIFGDDSTQHKNSIHIARHLQAVTQEPNSKAGDLFVAHFSGLVVDDKTLSAVGIFKSETKDDYLKVQGEVHPFYLNADEGINVKKPEKACLVFDAEEDEGFKILILDNAGKAEALFWKDEFLHVKPGADAFHRTRDFMNLTRQFVGEQLDEEFSVSKADKIDLLNRSMSFFKSRDQFNQNEFEDEVLADESVIESFRNYEKTFGSEDDRDHNFEISAQAVKRQARVFKSVLKLDKNFHIYIHGNRDLIEKGFDQTSNRHYYKIYFDQET